MERCPQLCTNSYKRQTWKKTVTGAGVLPDAHHCLVKLQLKRKHEGENGIPIALSRCLHQGRRPSTLVNRHVQMHFSCLVEISSSKYLFFSCHEVTFSVTHVELPTIILALLLHKQKANAGKYAQTHCAF